MENTGVQVLILHSSSICVHYIEANGTYRKVLEVLACWYFIAFSS